MAGYLYIFGTVLLTVYGQLIIKWQVSQAGPFPIDTTEKIWFIVHLLLNPWIISSVIGGFLAFLCWIGAMTKFELSYAYPFTSLAFVLVLVLSAIFFREAITFPKVLGLSLIVLGIITGSR
jgi:multidrug transporter EmrE-like cation transporter